MYELTILQWLAEKTPTTEKGFAMSVQLESFAIHMRNLIDFFYPDVLKNDDVVAIDFFDPPDTWVPGKMSTTLEAARTRANKEVSHLTNKRKSATDPDKPWAVGALFIEIHAVAKKFGTDASPKKLHSRVREFLLAGPTEVAAVLVHASSTTSNTAAVIVNHTNSGSVGKKTI